jgi:hypothetical protein
MAALLIIPGLGLLSLLTAEVANRLLGFVKENQKNNE